MRKIQHLEVSGLAVVVLREEQHHCCETRELVVVSAPIDSTLAAVDSNQK